MNYKILVLALSFVYPFLGITQEKYDLGNTFVPDQQSYRLPNTVMPELANWFWFDKEFGK